jgi:hypothetical protein
MPRPRLVSVSDREVGDDLTTSYHFSLPPFLADLHEVERDIGLIMTTFGDTEDSGYGGRLAINFRKPGRSIASSVTILCAEASWPTRAAEVLATPGDVMLRMLKDR